MKIKGLLVSFALFIFFQSSTYAILNLDLTKGIDSAVPIAVVPFNVQDTQKPSADISGIVSTDLADSGQFKLLDTDSMDQKPSQLSDIDLNYWRNQNVDDVAIGTIKAAGGNSFKVSYQLVDLYKDKTLNRLPTGASRILDMLNNPVLLNETYTIRNNGLRRLAHRIADKIYEKIIGIKGVFSTKIAYILVQRQPNQKATYSLEVADADGYNPRAILVSHEPIMSPTWSPDGRKMAYVSFEKRHAAIYISDLATGKRQLISRFPGINGAPAFSPDGKTLAMVLSKDGSPKIYTIDLRTKKLTQITRDWAIDTEPNWAPDGKSLIFTSSRSGGPQIYQVTLANHQVQRLTYVGGYNAKATFSPDGKSIVMLHRDQGMFDIAKQGLASGDVVVLSNFGDDQSPSVAPNGKMVIYASRDGDRGILKLVSDDGRVKLSLPESQGEVREPAWSPFL